MGTFVKPDPGFFQSGAVNRFILSFICVSYSYVAAGGLCVAQPLRKELEDKSRRFGLALFVDMGDGVAVYPFEGEPLSFRPRYERGTAIAAEDGKTIIWNVLGPRFHSDIVLETIEGRVLGRNPVSYWP